MFCYKMWPRWWGICVCLSVDIHITVCMCKQRLSSCHNPITFALAQYSYKTRKMKRETLNAFFTLRTDWLQMVTHERLNQNLTTQATESYKRCSRSTVFNILKGQTECYFASLVQFLNSPLSSITVHTSQLFVSVKLQQSTIFKKWLRQALHCPSCSMLVTRYLLIHRYER